jgi:hypothetical protein
MSIGPTTNSFVLTTPRADVNLEEIFFPFPLSRSLVVPPGVSVRFKHEMMLPPWFWKEDLSGGTHNFTTNGGWNKFKVALLSPGPVTVTWIIPG